MKIISKILPCILTLCALGGCNKKEEPKIEVHHHTFSEDFASDESYHWHISTCEHEKEISGKERHFFVNNVCQTCGATFSGKSKLEYKSSMNLDELLDQLVPAPLKLIDKFQYAVSLVKAIEKSAIGEENVTYARYSFEYPTTLLDGNRMMLSGAITIPYHGETLVSNGLVISSHPTFSDLSEAPSNGFGIYTIPVITGSIVLEFDLLGYGITDDQPIDYHCRHLSTRSTIDGVLSAIDLIQNEFELDISKLPMYNLGYSQGAYDSLALLRYMEQEATNEEKELINIVHTYSGAGAYNPAMMFEESLNNSEFGYSECLLLAIDAAFNFHKDAMGEIKYEEILTSKGMKFLNTVREKSSYKLDKFKQLNSVKVSDIFTSECLNTESDLFTALKEIIEIENLLDGKWTPTGDVTLYYNSKDELVTPNCTLAAIELWQSLENFDYESIGFLAGTDHKVASIDYYLLVIAAINDDINSRLGD